MKYYFSKARYADGSIRPQIFECFGTTMHAKIASTIIGSIAATNEHRDSSDKMTPKEVAVRACDIAQQLVTQFEEREWILELPEVIPPPSPPFSE